MKEEFRIGVLGIGGTGGFFGGKLAAFYEDSDAVKVIFIARNETKSLIRKQGLQVESVEGDFSIKPFLVSDDPAEIGPLDILFVCVKSYSLEEAVCKYIKNVKKGGVVITIQNSVNQQGCLQSILPEGVTHLEGCAYILSNKIDIGHIKHKGGPATIFFGNDTATSEFKWAEDIFTQAGVKATLTNEISKTIWKKFLFISPLAVATSYFSCTIGELRSSPEKFEFLKGLMQELYGLVKLKNIALGPDEIENHLNFLENLPENGKTSLQLDIENGSPSEIDSLLEYVLIDSRKYGLDLKNYQLAYEGLKNATYFKT